jgi:DNA-binding protein YbaB
MTHSDDLTFDAEGAVRFAAELRSRAKRLEEEVAATEIDVTSRDKSVTVTVTITGKVRGLKLDRVLCEDRDPGEFAEAILATVQRAQEIGEQAGKDLVSRYLPNAPDFGKLLSSVGAPR